MSFCTGSPSRLRRGGSRTLEGGQVLSGGVRETAKDLADLLLFLFRDHHQFVIDGHGFDRLDERGLLGAGRTMNHPFEGAPGLRLDHENRATVAVGHDFVLKDLIGIGLVEIRVENQVEIFA